MVPWVCLGLAVAADETVPRGNGKEELRQRRIDAAVFGRAGDPGEVPRLTTAEDSALASTDGAGPLVSRWLYFTHR